MSHEVMQKVIGDLYAAANKEPTGPTLTAIANAIQYLQSGVTLTDEGDIVQPEQEPVGYMVACEEAYWIDMPPPIGFDLYTSPPRRQPLTDEESHQTLLDMAQHVEEIGTDAWTNQKISAECIRFILKRVEAIDIKERNA